MEVRHSFVVSVTFDGTVDLVNGQPVIATADGSSV